MNQENSQLWKRLAAIGAAAVILILLVLGGGSISSGSQGAAGPLATVAAGGAIQIDLNQGSSGEESAAGQPERRKTATPTPRPRRTPTATPTRAHTQRTPAVTPTRAGQQQVGGLPVIYVDQLPREARETLRLIEEGGPFPYSKDGVVFQNREGILPNRPRGYYHEYTVITPGESDRGARRIVTGEGGELYYTDDHYDSFKRILER